MRWGAGTLKKLLLEGSGVYKGHGMPGIKPGSTACKVNAHPLSYCSGPKDSIFEVTSIQMRVESTDGRPRTEFGVGECYL